jgi:hypothetical protein
MKLNGYEIVSELTKWKDMIRRNKLSKDSLEKLRKSKVAVPIRRYIKGVKQGTDNIMKKNRATFVDHPGVDSVHPQSDKYITTHMSDPLFGRIHRVAGLKGKERRDSFIGDRHEADEIDIERKFETNPMRMNRNTLSVHSSPRVLKRERNILKHAATMYRNKKGDYLGSTLAKDRIASGEYDVLNKLKPKQIRKIEKDSSDWANDEVIASDYIKK